MNTIYAQVLDINIEVIIKIVLYTCFVFISAFFAAIETALLKYTALKFEVKEQIKKYISVWEENPEVILGTILIGTNLACIGIGVLNTSLGLWIGWSIIILLVLGEILPKVYALTSPSFIINYGIKWLVKFSKIVSPVTNFLVNLSMYFTSIFLRIEKETPFFTKKDIQEIVYKEESISGEEKQLYYNIIELADKRIFDIMVPKENIVAVDISWGLEEIINKLSNTKFSRIPVYKDNIDNIIGIIYTKDLVLAIQNKELLILDDFLREAYFVVNTAHVIDVLKQFKQGRHHMAIVVDEYGSTVGIVTIEDIIEELVGEIYDEYDIKEQKLKKIGVDTIIVSGDESIKSIEESLGIKLEDEGVATINGYVVTKLGIVPEIGDKFVINNLEIEILDRTKRFIKKLRIKKV
jgi:CBS domain containing-hemolysin-like protein